MVRGGLLCRPGADGASARAGYWGARRRSRPLAALDSDHATRLTAGRTLWSRTSSGRAAE